MLKVQTFLVCPEASPAGGLDLCPEASPAGGWDFSPEASPAGGWDFCPWPVKEAGTFPASDPDWRPLLISCDTELVESAC